MMPIFDLGQLEPQLEALLAEKQQVLVTYVYGSQAQGRAGPLSDLDVAVLLAGEPSDDECFEARLDLIGELMSLLRTNDVDVAVLNRVPLVIRYQVLRTGVIVYCRDREAMIDFRVRTLNDYFDFKPVLDHHRKVLFRQILEGTWLDGYNPYRGKITSDPLFAIPASGDPAA